MALWHHQEYTIDKLKRTQRGLDLSDPGTGKTLTHLTLYNRRTSAGRCLVVCPKTLMESAWAADVDKFLPHLTYSLATAKNRFEAFEADTDLVIINTDGVTALNKLKKAQIARLFSEFDHLIVDESSTFKHASSQRSKAMLGISKHFDWRFELSGTPNPISVTELWHQAMILDGGERLGKAFFHFRNAMQEATQVGPQPNHLRWDDKPQANEVTMHMLRDVVVRHAFEEVMTDVPPNHVDRKYITLPNKLRKQYQQLEDTALMVLKDGYITPVHAAALRTKLLQLCSGAVYGGESEEGYEVLDPYRYDLITDLIEERQHSLTFFVWKHQRDLLVQSLTKRGFPFAIMDGDTPDTRRAQIVREYQAGQYKTLLLHPRTGAHGLTLTRGTASIVCSPIYEADILKQLIHRIYRGGQTQVTNTLLVCAKDTVEELVYERLNHKKLRMDDFLRLVQEAKHQ